MIIVIVKCTVYSVHTARTHWHTLWTKSMYYILLDSLYCRVSNNDSVRVLCAQGFTVGRLIAKEARLLNQRDVNTVSVKTIQFKAKNQKADFVYSYMANQQRRWQQYGSGRCGCAERITINRATNCFYHIQIFACSNLFTHSLQKCTRNKSFDLKVWQSVALEQQWQLKSAWVYFVAKVFIFKRRSSWGVYEENA